LNYFDYSANKKVPKISIQKNDEIPLFNLIFDSIHLL